MPYFFNSKLRAFTLLELMISIVIVGSLAAAAVPSFQKYLHRSKMAEGYLFIRKMHDTAVVDGSIAYETAVSTDSGQAVTCLKQYPFGQLRSYMLGQYGWIAAPPSGKKEKIYFRQNGYYNPVTYYALSADNIVCVINNTAYPKPERYGFAVENVDPSAQYTQTVNPTYFAVSIYPDYSLAQNLIAEGKNAAYYDVPTQRHMSTAILVYADLDGDYEAEYDEDEEEYSSALLGSSGGSDKVSYLMRGIYYDTVTGEIVSTEGIYSLNFGE
ncbi:MAG TPA: prepilin-type N-terminal cleavage/methylation domain-containing protein [Oligoflexia bacterium]|nr:prepilin-type N-terminal cleavage/methylation domain-containing protein [Oligoflexia bacterium]HMR25370.1 prepilin-type N-terminal cleavage/methylation domain-containing protein [Oligoflexia bacterium]